MDWNYFRDRKRITLKDFLIDCSSEEEAMQKFSKKNLMNLPLEEISQLFSTPTSVATEASEEIADVKLSSKKVVKNATENPGE